MKKLLKELQEIKKLLQIIVSNQEQVERISSGTINAKRFQMSNIKKDTPCKLPKPYYLKTKKGNVSVVVGKDSGRLLIQKAGGIQIYKIYPTK